MSLKYKARVNITADKDFKADIKRIRKYSESEYVKALMRFHYRDLIVIEPSYTVLMNKQDKIN